MDGRTIDGVHLSTYITETLNSKYVAQYVEKSKEIGCVDPYNIPQHQFQDITTPLGGELPKFQHSDIYSYLIYFKNVYTHKELKAYRSLEAYKYFVAGWVREILITDIVHPDSSHNFHYYCKVYITLHCYYSYF